jgi:hypothetical protein
VSRAGSSAPLPARRLRELDLEEPPGAGEPAYLSAASGLVHTGAGLYVVSDDEQHLGCFDADGAAPGTLLRLFEGDLPRQLKARKKRKADLEILLRLPPAPGHSHGALLALGSGSKKRRRRGVLLPLDAHGKVRGKVIDVDASPLYERLEREFDDLNLEGGWIHASHLFLLQRGNKGESPNAVIELDHAEVMATLLAEGVLPDLAPKRVTEMDLGAVQSVPLCFTDASCLPDGSWLFSAVAEDTDDAVADGAFVGAAIGLATPAHRLEWLRPLAPACKVEGVDARLRDGRIKLLCVTDADDPAVPAHLLQINL